MAYVPVFLGYLVLRHWPQHLRLPVPRQMERRSLCVVFRKLGELDY
jgi:hypothetical protein